MKPQKLILAAMSLLCMAPTVDVWGSGKSQVRCEAITKKGTRCKNKALERSKYCRVHQAKDPNVAQCKAKIKVTRCNIKRRLPLCSFNIKL